MAFRVAENVCLSAWLGKIRPSYALPSCYVFSHTIMNAEAAQAHVEEVDRMKSRKWLTLLFDGWEDKLQCSLYGTVVAELGTPLTVLSLDELTGLRGMAETYLATIKGALKKMNMEDAENVIALTTDNPNVMRAF